MEMIHIGNSKPVLSCKGGQAPALPVVKENLTCSGKYTQFHGGWVFFLDGTEKNKKGVVSFVKMM